MTIVPTSPSIDALVDLVPYLDAPRRPEPFDHAVADLLDPDRLADIVAATAEGRGSDDPIVLASLWWQSYAYRTAGALIAAWVLTGSAPDPGIDTGIAIRISRARPAKLVLGADATEITDPVRFLDRLFTNNLDPLADALRARHRIGRRLVDGNTMASIATGYSTVTTADGAPDGLEPRIEAISAHLPAHLSDLVRWITPYSDRRRTTCCLFYKSAPSDGRYCKDCSLR